MEPTPESSLMIWYIIVLGLVGLFGPLLGALLNGWQDKLKMQQAGDLKLEKWRRESLLEALVPVVQDLRSLGLYKMQDHLKESAGHPFSHLNARSRASRADLLLNNIGLSNRIDTCLKNISTLALLGASGKVDETLYSTTKEDADEIVELLSHRLVEWK